ncbi:MAG: amino acid aminotransferase [Pseudomonadota bacterium]
MWKNIEQAPADAIFGLTDAFKKDTNPNKVNLGAGVYKDDSGNTPILESVKAAEKMLLSIESSKSYLPISGDPAYARSVQKLLFGETGEAFTSERAATIHAPGGTGALRMGAELLKKFSPDAAVWVSSPTWANHKGIFSAAGFKIKEYPYYDAQTKSVDVDPFFTCLKQIPQGDIVLLHACCHNPSGVDLSDTQWRQVADIAKEKNWTPFLDFAYQGFGSGIEEDRFAIDIFCQTGLDLFIASSFSKNIGLYNERTGALTIVSPTQKEAQVAMSHLKLVVRVCYSNPPAHGGLVVSTILNNKELTALWIEEVSDMRKRIVAMRTALVDGLARRGVVEDFSYIKQQRGMFSFSGLSNDTVAWLKEHKSIYVVGGGRISVAGLTTGNIDYICDSIAQALKA